MSKAKRYQILLSNNDVLEVHLKISGSKLVDFSVQYKAYIRGKWRRVIRYDTAHGFLHVHKEWHEIDDHEPVPQIRELPYRSVLPWVKDEMKHNWRRYRRYIETRFREINNKSERVGEEE